MQVWVVKIAVPQAYSSNFPIDVFSANLQMDPSSSVSSDRNIVLNE